MSDTRTAYRCLATCPEIVAAREAARRMRLAAHGVVSCGRCGGLCLDRHHAEDGKARCVACFTHGDEGEARTP